MTREAYLKKLGINIATIRKRKGLSQSQLAVRCGKERQNMNRLEKGGQNPTIFLLFEISKALGVPVKDLIDFE